MKHATERLFKAEALERVLMPRDADLEDAPVPEQELDAAVVSFNDMHIETETLEATISDEEDPSRISEYTENVTHRFKRQ